MMRRACSRQHKRTQSQFGARWRTLALDGQVSWVNVGRRSNICSTRSLPSPLADWFVADVDFLAWLHSLAFSVTLFCTTAVVAMSLMMLRRSKMIGGELGGPKKWKIATSTFFVFLWLFYVMMSSLEAYGYIQGNISCPDILFSFISFCTFAAPKCTGF